MGAEPEAAGIEEQGLGWHNRLGSGLGVHTTSSGIEGAWKPNPTQWDNGYFDMLFGYEWQLTKSPSGAHQWTPVDVRITSYNVCYTKLLRFASVYSSL